MVCSELNPFLINNSCWSVEFRCMERYENLLVLDVSGWKFDIPEALAAKLPVWNVTSCHWSTENLGFMLFQVFLFPWTFFFLYNVRFLDIYYFLKDIFSPKYVFSFPLSFIPLTDPSRNLKFKNLFSFKWKRILN